MTLDRTYPDASGPMTLSHDPDASGPMTLRTTLTQVGQRLACAARRSAVNGPAIRGLEPATERRDRSPKDGRAADPRKRGPMARASLSGVGAVI